MPGKVFQTSREALEGIARDNMTVMAGGFGLCGMPASLLIALRHSGVKGLTCISNNAGIDGQGLSLLLETRQIRKMVASYVGNNKLFESQYLNGEIELEFCPQGTLAERCRAGGAGIPAFYSRTGVGTELAEGKELREFDGVKYMMQRALKADISLIKAEVADTEGNLIYRKTARNFNPDMAMAGEITIAEVERIVPAGTLGADNIHTPGIFVQRIVKTDTSKQIEFETTRDRKIS